MGENENPDGIVTTDVGPDDDLGTADKAADVKADAQPKPNAEPQPDEAPDEHEVCVTLARQQRSPTLHNPDPTRDSRLTGVSYPMNHSTT